MSHQFAAQLESLDSYIEAEMQKWHVVGMAVAVLHNGEVVHQKGYGSRDLDNPQPVDTETLFAIGSCTKAVTTMGLALLVDEGKLDWDKPIQQYLPQFKLYDPVATLQMTARDLVCHRSGLPRHDFMWYGSSLSRWELFERLQYLQPSYPFRYVFQYQNLMYMVAGCLIEAITGQTWETFTQERILDKLDMSQSNFSVAVSEKAENAAAPHHVRDNASLRIPFRNIDAVAPAGSINSNLVDMAKWLKMHMNGGKHGEAQFVSEANLAQTHLPHVTVPPTPPMSFPELQQNSYGLGWAQQNYRGHYRVRHTGGIDGFITDVSFLPQQNLGVIVFNNSEDSLSLSVAMHIYDCLLELEPIDWRERISAAENTVKGMVKEAVDGFRAKQQANTEPSHDLGAYIGEYEHPGYGVVTVTQTNGDLYAEYNTRKLKLKHFHYDVFEGEHDLGDDVPPYPISFQIGLDGDISSLTIQLEPAVEAQVFKYKSKDESSVTV
jgi:CubicO group peptidase (beta-lactamase class C family)